MRVPWVAPVTFAAVQTVLACWWAAFHPGLFSRDSVQYLSHTLAGPWVSDHSVLYDALLWLSFTATGDLGLVTLAQTTGMAGALTYLAQSLKALGAPRRTTTAVAIALPFLPTTGAFTVTFWKDVPFTICAIAVAAACAGLAARRTLTPARLAGLGTLLVLLGLFRPNGFLVVAVTVAVLLVVVGTRRVPLALIGTAAAALPLLLNNLIFPQLGIVPPAKTYVFHTAFADLAVAYRERPELFTERDRAVLASVAPLTRWTAGGTCSTVNPLIWRRDFSWARADAHTGDLLGLWTRLLVAEPALVLDTRLCRGAIAWRVAAEADGPTYRLSLRPDADTYVGPHKVPDFPERHLFSLRPLSADLHGVALTWLTATLAPRFDWLLWRGTLWSYLSYAAVALAALALRGRWVLAVAAIVVGQQLAILVNISAQDFRYLASPIFIGIMLVPLLAGAALRPLRRRPAPPDAVPRRGGSGDGGLVAWQGGQHQVGVGGGGVGRAEHMEGAASHGD
jgi:hypothetical protein